MDTSFVYRVTSVANDWECQDEAEGQNPVYNSAHNQRWCQQRALPGAAGQPGCLPVGDLRVTRPLTWQREHE